MPHSHTLAHSRRAIEAIKLNPNRTLATKGRQGRRGRGAKDPATTRQTAIKRYGSLGPPIWLGAAAPKVSQFSQNENDYENGACHTIVTSASAPTMTLSSI